MLKYQVGDEFRLFVKVPSSPVILRCHDSANACACGLPCTWYVVVFLKLFFVLGTLLAPFHLNMRATLALSPSYR